MEADNDVFDNAAAERAEEGDEDGDGDGVGDGTATTRDGDDDTTATTVRGAGRVLAGLGTRRGDWQIGADEGVTVVAAAAVAAEGGIFSR